MPTEPDRAHDAIGSTPDWRVQAWSRLRERWDLIIIGGGMTGAGILALAARMGLSALLLEQQDFGSGTSSRSSKLVHGGLRYLKQMQIKLTRESVRERQTLLHEAAGLVEPLQFVYPVYAGDSPGAWVIGLGLDVYTHLGGNQGGYRELAPVDLLMLAPGLAQRQARGRLEGRLEMGYLYTDAQTDDARLVLRVLNDAVMTGEGRCVALNYARVAGLVRAGGSVFGVQVRDEVTGKEEEALAAIVINATGAWADKLRGEAGERARLRPLRGSHLFFRPERFPIYQAVSMLHPSDRRPVFAYPWQGVILLGTTDVDDKADLNQEPAIARHEAEYLLQAVQAYFPSFELGPADVISTQAGVRPVIDTGKEDPSAETRDHVVWNEHGLLTVTGGKLTTFRVIARDALAAAHDAIPELPRPPTDLPALLPTPAGAPLPGIDPQHHARLWGRYGVRALDLARHAATAGDPDEGSPHWGGEQALIPESPYLWAELAWSAGHEAIVHLDDLLLRRFRLGILHADGGQRLLTASDARLRGLVQPALGWSDDRWREEVARYLRLWRVAHGSPFMDKGTQGGL